MTDKKKIKYCKYCYKELSTSKYSTTSLRTDGYCTAKCKKKARNEFYKDLNNSRVCDPDTEWF